MSKMNRRIRNAVMFTIALPKDLRHMIYHRLPECLKIRRYYQKAHHTYVYVYRDLVAITIESLSTTPETRKIADMILIRYTNRKRRKAARRAARRIELKRSGNVTK